jgi:PAS domain S-box-containing protein
LVEQDRHLIITGWSSEAERFFGWRAAEVIGRRSDLLIPGRNRHRYGTAIDTLLASPIEQDALQRDITMVHRDGRELKVSVVLRIALRDGEPHIVALFGDRSTSERLHQPVVHAEQDLRDLLDRLDDGYFEIDLNGRFVAVNEAYCRMVGRSASELVGFSFKQLVRDTECVETTQNAYQKIYETGQPLRGFETTVIRKDGSKRHVEDSVALKRNANGQPIGYIGIRRDCTDRRETADHLKVSEERYRVIVERIEDGYFEIDLSRKGRYAFVNDAFCRIVGYSREELIGRSYTDFYDVETAAWLYDKYHRVYLTGGPLKALEYSLVRKDGTRRFVEESVSLRKDASGAVVGFMGIRRDCTERKIADQELANAKEAAESANRAKSEFLANMSHEIRTPMNGIIGMTELALGTELTPYQIECLGTVQSSAESLLAIINDILDFSKIESRRLELERTTFSLSDVIGETVKPIAVRAHQKNLEIITDVPPEIPDALVGDPVRLRQVLTNLLGNAIKFTERGHVMLAVCDEPHHDGRATLRFSVSDTGIGIPADKHAKIFDAFCQADGSTTRRFGGTGLGLAISSQLVRMMGGEITVSSALGRGSTFEFGAEFSLAAERRAPVRVPRLGSLPVLVVDDNEANRAIFERQLTRWGMRPTGVSGGQAAIDELRAAAKNGTGFRLVLLDSQMPEVDGFAVASAMANTPELAGTPIVMLTPEGGPGDVARCQELGIRTWMTKPVRQADLSEAIGRALEGRDDAEGKRVAAPISTVDAVRGVRVLLVEDNVVNQRVALGLLTNRGHHVTVASTGLEAVEAIEKSSYDVVLMDVQMPVMGGLEATAEIRRRERDTGRPRVKIIAMTAHAIAGDRERCLAAGMDGYLSKPIEPRALFGIVDQPTEPAAAPEAIPDDVFNRGEALVRLAGDEQLLKEVQQLFIVACAGQLAALAGAAERGDLMKIRTEAHSLKGAASNLAARRLADAALALETIAHEGRVDAVKTACTAVATEAERLLAAFQPPSSSAAA